MSTLPGTSCLLTDLEGEPPRPLSAYATRRRALPRLGDLDPGPDDARATLAAVTGRPSAQCCVCGVSLGETFTRRSKSGKTFCLPCAKQTVAAYYDRHPEARPVPPRLGRERTGTSYLAERERYEVRYHAGNARWQISDTQTRRWSSRSDPREDGAQAIAAAMNAAWRDQVASERGARWRAD